MILITGASGQDGLILSKVLAMMGERVIALGSEGSERLGVKEIVPEVEWMFSSSNADLPLDEIKSKPKQIFHFAGESSVQKSWEQPTHSTETNVALSMKIIRFAVKNESKLILASSSEMYPRQVSVVSESDPIKASSPYGVSKATAFELAQLLRNEGRLLVSNLIMFNHESPLRKKQFLTKKLTDQLLQVADGVRTNISVWDKSASKDFSWAADFIRPMVSKTMMDLNDDFVLASGKSTTVEELALAGLRLIGLSVPVLEERDAAITAAPNPTGNPSKAEKLLGFRKTQDGAEVMRKLIELELKTSGLSQVEAAKIAVKEIAEEGLT